MGKEQLDIEYPLATKSPTIVWEQISSAHGLERWMADHVRQDEDVMTFTWGEPWTQQDTKTARIIDFCKNDHIRLKWIDDEEEDLPYWEMRIGRSELTGMLCLQITDFAIAGESGDLRDLWNGNIERLHRASGL